MDLSRDYQNGAFIPGSDALPALWAQKAAAFRASLGARARLDLAYGPAERNRFDLFLPETPPHGLMVFIHGGYWLATHKDLWSHLAAGAIARGWACAMPSYTLAPQARITQITAEVDAAVTAACAEIAGPVVVTGHSAGGHLAARMGNDRRDDSNGKGHNELAPACEERRRDSEAGCWPPHGDVGPRCRQLK